MANTPKCFLTFLKKCGDKLEEWEKTIEFLLEQSHTMFKTVPEVVANHMFLEFLEREAQSLQPDKILTKVKNLRRKKRQTPTAWKNFMFTLAQTTEWREWVDYLEKKFRNPVQRLQMHRNMLSRILRFQNTRGGKRCGKFIKFWQGKPFSYAEKTSTSGNELVNESNLGKDPGRNIGKMEARDVTYEITTESASAES